MKGLLFSDEMVCAILSGRKTQTRRLRSNFRAGDVIYVREAWAPEFDANCVGARFRADGALLWPDDLHGQPEEEWILDHWPDDSTWRANNGWVAEDDGPWVVQGRVKWRPGIHMPKWAARIKLCVLEVFQQPLHDIDDASARSEGVADREAFAALWDDLNTHRAAWDSNPTVTVINFERIE